MKVVWWQWTSKKIHTWKVRIIFFDVAVPLMIICLPMIIYQIQRRKFENQQK